MFSSFALKRNPFCYENNFLFCQCLAIGKVHNRKENLAIVKINETIATVSSGDECSGMHIVAITDTSVIIRDKQNHQQEISL